MNSCINHYGDKQGLLVLSKNAIITFIISNRNFGKTWTFKRRAFRRALKHHKKTIWLRMFKKEVKEAAKTFYTSRDLQEYCGIDEWDKDTNPNGNFKQVGNTFFYRTDPKHKWNWFLKIFALSDADALRSADDVDVDTIIGDELMKTADKYRRYRGNPVTDLIDIFFSAKREHQIRIFILGNKECINNPYYNYFGIKPLPSSFEGIRTYRNGAIAIQQINNVAKQQNDYDAKVLNLLKGTQYGNYVYSSVYKSENAFKKRKTPPNANIYCQIYINNAAVKISIFNGLLYVNNKIDNTRPVYCDRLTGKYKHEYLLARKLKKFFTTYENALVDNRIYYDDASTYEALEYFNAWLSV